MYCNLLFYLLVSLSQKYKYNIFTITILQTKKLNLIFLNISFSHFARYRGVPGRFNISICLWMFLTIWLLLLLSMN